MTTEFKKMKFTKKQLNIPDDGDIHLHDLTFDFEDYFDRHGTDKMDDEESKEFDCRVMGLFCKDFWESGGNPAAIQPWVANYLAEAFYNICGGVPLNQALQTPFEPPSSMFTEKGRRAMDIYAHIQNNRSSGDTISGWLVEASKELNLSYEAVRGDYYAVRGVLKDKKPWPKGFLKIEPEN